MALDSTVTCSRWGQDRRTPTVCLTRELSSRGGHNALTVRPLTHTYSVDAAARPCEACKLAGFTTTSRAQAPPTVKTFGCVLRFTCCRPDRGRQLVGTVVLVPALIFLNQSIACRQKRRAALRGEHKYTGVQYVYFVQSKAAKRCDKCPPLLASVNALFD